MTLSDRDRRALVVGLALLGALAVVHFVALPWVAHWREARSGVRQITADLTDLQAKVQRLQHIRQRLLVTHGPASQAPLLDVQQAQVELYRAVQQALQTGGMQFESITPRTVKPIKEIPGVYLVALQMRGTGQLPQLAKGLAAMGKGDTLIIVDQITATSNEKQPGNLALTLELATLAWSDPKP